MLASPGREQRLAHRAALKAEIESGAGGAALPGLRWPLLTDAGAFAGPVYSVRQALAHPQKWRSGMVATFEAVPGGPRHPCCAPASKARRAAPAVATPPRLGEHTRQILAEAGFDAAQVDAFERGGRCDGLVDRLRPPRGLGGAPATASAAPPAPAERPATDGAPHDPRTEHR